jgi:CRISPR-associated endonuclease/helicase Cas3
MKTFAHSVEGQPEGRWEFLTHHLAAVGRTSADFAGWFGASTIALAMGLLHDIGKAALLYQLYIRRPTDRSGPKGPDHSSAGAKEAVALYGTQLGRMMAFGVAGHHAGLMDGSGHEGGNLNARLAKDVEDYTGWQEHVAHMPTTEAVRAELPALKPNCIEPAFSGAFLARMLFSCLVDADFLETEAFYARSLGDEPPPRGGTLTPEHVECVHDYVARHRRDDTPVNRLRSEILDHADAKAALPPGLFTLTVPTGGGKTLTSLSFAMRHAAAHGLRRIIYVIPFAEAWIETGVSGNSPSSLIVASRGTAL